MSVFRDASELQQCMGKLYETARRDERIAPKIRDGNMVIQFRYTEPESVVTILGNQNASDDAYFDVVWGEQPELKPDVEMSMKADIAHQFWHGKINLLAALARRQIVARGPIPKLLKLLPAVEPMYGMYPQILHEQGRDDLVIA